jgi:hypothetical protein
VTVATEIHPQLAAPVVRRSPVSEASSDDAVVMLGVLAAVEREPQVTQRRLSSDLGIALGLANAILKRCVRHGLIKISQAPLNRYTYYLTPTGFAEKTRLTLEHLRYSFNLFRDARTQYSALFALLAAQGLRRVALLGVSELAEAAQLSAREAGVSIVSVYDRAYADVAHVGIPVVRSLAALAGQVDALALTDMRAPNAVLAEAYAACESFGLDRSRVLVPVLLAVTPNVPDSAAASAVSPS